MLGSNFKVLLVCAGIINANQGNTCRSPMAQEILKSKSKGMFSTIKSAGIKARENQSANPKTVAVLAKRGITFEHMTQQFLEQYFQEYDYILCMDKSNFADLHKMKPEKCRADIELIGSFGDHDPEVPDPYGGTMEDYELTYARLNQFCDEFLHYFVNKSEI
ncbi:hypothetical protein HDV06_004274 [Boothiomyces sp. JEL0866]|nr:hypothetical protein HDV06_004274 [Boothiomyces sp. JEL0866]